MKPTICILSAYTVLSSFVNAADFEGMKRTPAQIEVVNMQPGPLVESADKKGWARVPAQLTKYNAVIYTSAGGTNGVADIKVTGDGYLMVACNYDY